MVSTRTPMLQDFQPPVHRNLLSALAIIVPLMELAAFASAVSVVNPCSRRDRPWIPAHRTSANIVEPVAVRLSHVAAALPSGLQRLALVAIMREKMTPSAKLLAAKPRQYMKPLFAILLSFALLFSGLAAAESAPAESISGFRLKHGEGSVAMDATLNRIALEQAKAMAARDTLDHDVLGSFSSRIAPAKAGRAAENIAYGYDSFEKTLDQWIASAGHRKNLLLTKASRVGVASARSATSHRTYWAMEIAGDYETRPIAEGKRTPPAAKRKTSAQPCRVRLLGLCF